MYFTLVFTSIFYYVCKMTHGSLFSGIGGFDLAAEWMGWENVFHCEMNPFGRQVLNYYWPNSISYDDITKTDFTIHRETIDILTGGFPCQPYSHAGKRLGKEDDRHLWPEMLRAIREIQPTWVVGENVSGLISWNGGLVFHEVQTDLEAEGYEAQPFVLPACAVNAPHRRDRVWFIAYNNSFIRGTRGNVKPGKQSRHGESILPITAAGPTTNPNSNGHELRGFGEDRCTEGESIGKQEQRERVWANDRGIGEQGIAPNAASQQGERMRPEQREFGEPKQRQLRGNGSGLGGTWVPTNTCNEGLQGSEVNGSITGIRKERNKQLAGCVPSTWQNFPTQPPVCSRNDGLPAGLVGITVSKHRNESIKAYGNAIVPQVALQIFKAIQSFPPPHPSPTHPT